jgi:RNA polymerase sigma-70 factor (ECF subfamily)
MNNQGAAADWLPAARAGSLAALGEGFDGCRNYLLGIAERELDSDLRAKAGASDLVQETFMDAQKIFARFEGKTEGEWLAWLRQLLLYNVAGFTRRYRTGKRSAELETPFGGADSSSLWQADLPATDGTPSAAVRKAEETAVVEAAIAQLPPEYQQVVRWRYQENLSFVEIGERLGRSQDAVRRAWAHAIDELHQHLPPDEPPGP